MGFKAHLGEGLCSNIVAELQAVRVGLLLAWDEGFKVIWKLDAKVVIDLICKLDAKVICKVYARILHFILSVA